MVPGKTNIIAALQQEIMALQGFKSTAQDNLLDESLGPIRHAFPRNGFPLGAIHEFIYQGAEQAAATAGFVSGILGALLRNNGNCIWVTASRTLFPPALRSFEMTPEHIIFIEQAKDLEKLWVMEEALKCSGLAAVVGEIRELSFDHSRRLQLAVEQSQVTGFVLRNNPRNLSATACLTRWMISPLSSELSEGLPGIGFPRWKVALVRVRNGKPGNWEVEFSGGRMRLIPGVPSIQWQAKKKAV